jgi:hypothetical protein
MKAAPVTTVSLGPAPPKPVPLGAAAARPQSRGVLVEVEFRKMLDTRAGLALAVATLVASVVVVCSDLARPGRHPVVVRALIQDAAMPPTVFLPVLAVLAVTAEWSQRTAVVTFTLSPWRNRVLAAKAGAALVLGALVTGAVVLLAGAVGAAAAVLTGHVDYSRTGEAVGAAFAGDGIAMLMGVACGALVGSIPAALAVYYLLPAVWSGLLAGRGGWTDWVDITGAIARVSHLRLAGAVPQTAVAVAVWVVLPAVAGLVVGARREVG